MTSPEMPLGIAFHLSGSSAGWKFAIIPEAKAMTVIAMSLVDSALRLSGRFAHAFFSTCSLDSKKLLAVGHCSSGSCAVALTPAFFSS